ncbi:uncharacterized protein LOC118481822 [Helianthus annuus]|uniref:uncharacterized protein LOC118481822 n=1 Tax=Helianthus annuus TaxID=4232 RepID=UPI001652C16A|nr:uncharacterized protein LOC118481822 [Helianthus annuus]
MARHGFTIKSKVTEAFIDGRWEWPEEWRSVYPVLFQLRPLSISEMQDRRLWMNSDGKLVPFTTKEVWNLWTQDRIMKWNHPVTGSMNLMCCLLCQSGLETHEHLFFECPYSKSVWHKVSHKVDMNSIQESWENISAWLIARANSKSVFSVASRLVVAAAAYVIWSERNARFFSNRLRPPEQLADRIISTVRTKLISFRYKQTSNVKRFMEEWKMDKEDFLDEDFLDED